MAYLDKNDPRVLLAEYKKNDDTVSDVLEDLVVWIEYEWDSGLTSENEKKCIKMIIDVINLYGNRNSKIMKLMAEAEKVQLEDWIRAVKGE